MSAGQVDDDVLKFVSRSKLESRRFRNEKFSCFPRKQREYQEERTKDVEEPAGFEDELLEQVSSTDDEFTFSSTLFYQPEIVLVKQKQLVQERIWKASIARLLIQGRLPKQLRALSEFTKISYKVAPDLEQRKRMMMEQKNIKLNAAHNLTHLTPNRFLLNYINQDYLSQAQLGSSKQSAERPDFIVFPTLSNKKNIASATSLFLAELDNLVALLEEIL